MSVLSGDVLIANGRVIDPLYGFNTFCNVLLKGGRVAALIRTEHTVQDAKHPSLQRIGVSAEAKEVSAKTTREGREKSLSIDLCSLLCDCYGDANMHGALFLSPLLSFYRISLFSVIARGQKKGHTSTDLSTRAISPLFLLSAPLKYART